MGRHKCFDRNEVLEKSIQLFWKKGFADTSLQDLEKATGVNKSGLYSEFKDKEDLFLQSLKHYTESYPTIQTLNREPYGRKNIEDAFLDTTSWQGAKGCFMANTARECSILPAAAVNHLKKHVSVVREAIIKNIKAAAPEKDAEFAADVIMTYNTGAALRMNLGEIPNFKKQLQKFLDMVLS